MAKTQNILRGQDEAIWRAARPHLDVRSNDAHTLYSYTLAQKLLDFYPEGNTHIVLPAILLHDTGWSRIPKDKILQAFGPNNKYPELTRQHEVEGVEIATEILRGLKFPQKHIADITTLIDGHDTTKHARSLDDSLMKDADKLWRYTPHGIATIQGWFEISKNEALDILEDYVFPTLLTEKGKILAETLLSVGRMTEQVEDWLKN